MPTVYVDLDGVLADFTGAIEKGMGCVPSPTKASNMWKYIKDYDTNIGPFFESLELCSDAMELWVYLTTNFDDVRILTASGKTPKDACDQKRKWVTERFGADVTVHVVCHSMDKGAFAERNAILIDDRTICTSTFSEKGGVSILHTSTPSTIKQLETVMELYFSHK